MALAARDYFKASRTLGKGTLDIIQVTKASGTTWVKGAVIIGTSGLAVEAADGPTTGTIIGVCILGVLTSGFIFLRIDLFYVNMVKGILIIAVVVADTYRHKRESKKDE